MQADYAVIFEVGDYMFVRNNPTVEPRFFIGWYRSNGCTYSKIWEIGR